VEKRILNIKGALLDTRQLENYLEKIASDHIITSSSKKETYPIPRLKQNFEYITKIYHLLNEHIKLGISIHPAGEWVLDNYYIIENSVKMIIKDLTLKKYIDFVGLENGNYYGFSRIYVLAEEVVAYTDGQIDEEKLMLFLKAYQNKKNLNMDEIWNLGIFIQISLIEKIRGICEKIYSSQIQKYKVENIIERLIENKQKLKFKNKINGKNLGYGQIKYPFIEYMSFRLKNYGKTAYAYMQILEEQVEKMGTDIYDIIKKEHFDIAVKKISLGNSVISINTIMRINFENIFEKINGVEEILKQDPLDIYDKMDYKSKTYYRNEIEKIAKKTKISEIYIAKKCLELSQNFSSQNNGLEINNSEMNGLKKNITIYNLLENKEKHIGYYLIDKGKEKLFSQLIDKKNRIKINKTKIYAVSIYFVTLILSIFITVLLNFKIEEAQFTSKFGAKLLSLFFVFILFTPLENIVSQITSYILSKIVKPKIIPKLDFQNGIPDKYSTMVVIPTVLNNKEKVHEIFEKLEIFYLANKSENIYFTLLGDCTSGKNISENYDEEIINQGMEEVIKLNKKYKSKINKFNFIYRKRIWNQSEEIYMGWERKRGLINQFNEYLLGKIDNPFLFSTFDCKDKTQKNDINIDEKYINIDKKDINIQKEDINIYKKDINNHKEDINIEKEDISIDEKDINLNTKYSNIKYIITLDSDTELVLNSGFELIGAMAHVLNHPVIDNQKKVIIEGYGIIQPRIGINLEACKKSLFTEIYGGSGGIDSYTNAISDIYQDNFGEGIFTGKGIYDLKIFSEVLNNKIPENTVLSHDLLEGNYLRCGLATDIMLMDGYPKSYNSFKTRAKRWIRGDYQILGWLKSNDINFLSKYKIFDNIIRSQHEIFSLSIIISSCLLSLFINISIWKLVLLSIISVIIPTILEITDKIVFKKDGQQTQKTFSKGIYGIKASLIRGIIAIMNLPDKAYTSVNSCVKTLYRMYITKKHLLEWITAEQAEKNSKTNLISYYRSMISNLFLAIFGIMYFIFQRKYGICLIDGYLVLTISILWIIAPYLMYKISMIYNNQELKIEDNDNKYLSEIARKTWLFFKEYLDSENNYLPPDNFQENRIPEIIKRTSPTNIGLAILSVISSYDMKFEKLEDTLELLEKMIMTIEKLPKWNGHLYNWYNIEDLKIVFPQYISSVDSGNFVGYLYILKQFLFENCGKCLIFDRVEKLIESTDFSKLYNEKTRLFSIGFNVEENKLTESYYDLLASEARQTSLIAIAKKDINYKHWYNLGRGLTVLNKYKGLISWSGTSFEYLMPCINISQYENSLLDESTKFMIMSQIEYCKKLEIPWGISESGFNLKDLNNNYQYKAFGIPWLGLKRGLGDEIVVSAYGSILGLNIVKKSKNLFNEILKNIRNLEKYGMLSKFGLYESIDFTPNRLEKGMKYSVVKTYMAHHQGLILASINNIFNNMIFQKRFYENPEIKALDVLLQERMPENVIITKEKKEKIEKIKYKDYENYLERTYKNPNNILDKLNLISNNDYSIIINQKGEGYSKYKNKIINRYKHTDDYMQGIVFFVKNMRTNKIWSSFYMDSENTNYLNSNKKDNYTVSFMPDKSIFVRKDGEIETNTQITIGIDESVEIRKMEIKNNGLNEEILEITSIVEPVLSSQEEDLSHKAFNNLFMKIEFLEEKNIILAKRKSRKISEKELYMGVKLCANDEGFGDYDFEINKEKVYGRGNYSIPKSVTSSKIFTKKTGLTTDPIIAIRKSMKLKPNEKAVLNFIICVSEDKNYIIEKIEKYSNFENVKRNFELSKVRVQEELRYLQLCGKETELYQRILPYLMFKNPLKKIVDKICDIDKGTENKKIYKIENLWKFGISGDIPILMIKIKNINDIKIVEEIIKAYEFYKTKNIDIDLVILNEEKESYENFVQEAIQELIYNRNIEHLRNIKGGIYLIKNISNFEKTILETRSSFCFDSNLGSIKNQLDELEEKYIENNNIEFENLISNEEPKLLENKFEQTELKYFNEFGGFTKDGKEYKIKFNKENKLPTVWSHIMANENFGTLTTECLGGYTWSQNSKLNKITALSNDQVLDTPSEIIFLQDKENYKIGSLNCNLNNDINDFYVTYGFGYSKLKHFYNNIEQELEMFVPIKEKNKISIIHLKNLLPKKRKLNIIYCIKPVLGEDEIKTEKFIKCELSRTNNCVYMKNLSNFDYDNIAYISSNEKITSIRNCKINNSIIEISSLNENNNSEKDIVDFKFGNYLKCNIDIDLEAFEEKDFCIILGSEESLIDCQNKAYKYSDLNICKTEYENTKKYWQDLLNIVQINTPIDSLNIMLNGWVIYQTLTSRLFGRTGFYQSGGAYGFRDQLQDTICLKYFEPEYLKKQIILHSQHQFIEGDVEHWWHEETSKGIRTRFSDDLLWLPYLVIEYIEFTGDYSILEKNTSYLTGKILDQNIDENYDLYVKSEIKESIYKHCVKAIDRALEFGKNGLPKIGTGDWNDGFSTVGNKGEGESVWLGFFIYKILEKFCEMFEFIEKENIVSEDFRKDITFSEKVRKDIVISEKIRMENKIFYDEKYEKYKKILDELKKSLNTKGWDGRWYRRAYTDEGDVLGSIENEECRIDSIAQSWSIISNAGDNDKKYICMESLENHLIDSENGLIKLLDPPFENSKINPGYIKSYLPGTRENGGQYTHAAIWAIIAATKLGFGNKALEWYRMINPIEHSRTKAETEKYKVEPYVIPADVYGQSNLAGRGGWTWYTGSASWFYEAGIKYILGIEIEKGILKVNPCVPNYWREYSIKFKYGMSIYNIVINNPNGKNTGVEKFIINGTEIFEKQIKLNNDGEINEIKIIM